MNDDEIQSTWKFIAEEWRKEEAAIDEEQVRAGLQAAAADSKTDLQQAMEKFCCAAQDFVKEDMEHSEA